MPYSPATSSFAWKNLSLFSVLMLCVPCYFWLTDYHWTLNQYIGHFDESLFWIVFTQTGSTPYAIFTSLIFIGFLLFLTRKTYRWQTILLLCMVSLASTQIIKSSIKQWIAEPRPYVMQMQQNHELDEYQVNAQTFYQLSETERATIVRSRAVKPDDVIMSDDLAVIAYQATELGYSFPSGHTIFAVSWLLVAVGLSQMRSKIMTIFRIALTLWAAAILYSRVWLGMHYPIDLFVSILLAWVVHLVLFGLCVPRWEKKFQAAF